MNIITDVNHGILFLKFDGVFDNNAFNKFNEKINYLLYNQGISYYTLNFLNVSKIEDTEIFNIQNKLLEIFLNCGKVVMCGVNKKYQKKIGKNNNRLYYVNTIQEAYNYLKI